MENARPLHYHLTPASLPRPFATESANNFPRVTARGNSTLKVAPGFTVTPWVEGLDRPRKMTVAPDGDVFVAESFAGRITMLRSDKAGRVTKYTFTTELRQPFGIGFYPPGPNPKFVYFANTNSVERHPYRNGDIQVRGTAEHLMDLPGGGYNQHWTRDLLFSPDGKRMFVTVGSASNASPEDAPRASILVGNPDGTGFRTFASGIRNPVGLAIEPRTGELWAAVNERDRLGDDLVPDYATHVQAGGFYGWPYYYIGKNHDPRNPERPDLKARVLVPDVLLESHCAALGIAFPAGKNSPFARDGFVSMHGSWNRSRRTGYKVVRVLLDAHGKAKGDYEDFVWGWKKSDDEVWGRPVDVQFDRTGAMLISDDGNGTIWRVTPKRK